MVFTGLVMDGVTGECIPHKLVRLRDTDGNVVAEDFSKTYGGYRVEGDVQRSPHCGGGEPVVRDDPEPGQSLPTFTYLPRRTPVSDGAEQVDLFRLPWGAVDAGTEQPAQCRAPDRPDGGTARDAAVPDGATADAGTPVDASAPDAAGPDAGTAADASAPDAARPDAGAAVDASAPDAAPPDAGTAADAAVTDGATPDAG
jgi:hypothetical protein